MRKGDNSIHYCRRKIISIYRLVGYKKKQYWRGHGANKVE